MDGREGRKRKDLVFRWGHPFAIYIYIYIYMKEEGRKEKKEGDEFRMEMMKERKESGEVLPGEGRVGVE
jgi:hypothetical protein